MKLADGLRRHDDDVVRCFWATDDPLYRSYHDDEWGMPVHDDARLFEKLCLEGFQSGLSWLTILRKREAFREAFCGFAIDRVASFGPSDVERLLGNAGIVRHRGKIEAAINNAGAAQALIAAEGSLDAYVWRHVPPSAERPRKLDASSLRALGTTAASLRLASDLKRRGFRFVGPTTAYAFMQAMGLVNDHIEGCDARPRTEAAQDSCNAAQALPRGIDPRPHQGA
jgi:DNA-3-methyladenine glycosylase I